MKKCYALHISVSRLCYDPIFVVYITLLQRNLKYDILTRVTETLIAGLIHIQIKEEQRLIFK